MVASVTDTWIVAIFGAQTTLRDRSKPSSHFTKSCSINAIASVNVVCRQPAASHSTVHSPRWTEALCPDLTLEPPFNRYVASSSSLSILSTIVTLANKALNTQSTSVTSLVPGKHLIV